MDRDAVRTKPPARSDPDRVRNALLGAVVFELAALALLSTDATGTAATAAVAGLAVSVLLGAVGLSAFLYYALTAAG